MPSAISDKPHAGRIAVVTGAARGIGQAIALDRTVLSDSDRNKIPHGNAERVLRIAGTTHE